MEAKESRQDKWQEEASCDLAFEEKVRKMGKEKHVTLLGVLIL